MKNILTALYVLLACTSWLWPILFVYNFLECVKGIVQQKEDEAYHKNFMMASVSLLCISIAQFILPFLF